MGPSRTIVGMTAAVIGRKGAICLGVLDPPVAAAAAVALDLGVLIA
jgi:hypothetical protein